MNPVLGIYRTVNVAPEPKENVHHRDELWLLCTPYSNHQPNFVKHFITSSPFLTRLASVPELEPCQTILGKLTEYQHLNEGESLLHCVY